MQLIVLSLTGFALMAIGIVIAVLGLRSAAGGPLSQRLQEYVTEHALPRSQWDTSAYIQQVKPSGSFGRRIILPFFRNLGRFFGRLTPTGVIDDLGKQLAIAGNPLGLGPREFYGLRLIINILGAWVAISTLRNGFNQINLIIAALALYLGTYIPKIWLRRSVRTRQDRIRRDMPDGLDMLSVCADAGLGFDQSLQRVSENWDAALAKEFGRVVAEMGMGVSRATALRSLANRLDVTELSSFVAVILQSDQLGMSIADTLHAQAEQMRVERRFRAQEQARKMPLKMLFPMILLIFPAMLVVILGPMIPVLGEFFASFTQVTVP